MCHYKYSMQNVLKIDIKNACCCQCRILTSRKMTLLSRSSLNGVNQNPIVFPPTAITCLVDRACLRTVSPCLRTCPFCCCGRGHVCGSLERLYMTDTVSPALPDADSRGRAGCSRRTAGRLQARRASSAQVHPEQTPTQVHDGRRSRGGARNTEPGRTPRESVQPTANVW